jgi:penicillin-binding protein 2
MMPLTENECYQFSKQLKYKRPNESIPIRLKLTEAEVAKFSVEKHRLPGVEIVAQLIRHYPLGEAIAHALGYVGPISQKDLTEIDAANYRGTHSMGKIGLEKSYETILHGKTGYQHVETDAKGRPIRVLNRIPPKPGADLYLSLDSHLQQSAFEALEGLKGAIVAIDPRTGGVLALISKPSFDPNLFAQGIESKTYRDLQDAPDKPLFNRAIRGQYPPGSTIKPLVALKALELGIVNTRYKIFDPGWYQLNGAGRLYRDWIYHSKRHGHGWVDLEKAMAQSCDTYFFTIAHKLGVDNLHEVFTAFGLGKKTNIDTTGEMAGLAPSPAWKKKVYNEPWYAGDTLNIGIGQGTLLATPLQIAQMTAIIANQGNRFEPRFVASIDFQDQKPHQIPDSNLSSPVILNNKEHWKTIIDAMKNVVHMPGSTAYRISHGLTYQMAGKTGTAQVFNLKQNEKYEVNKVKAHLRDHSWFIAFAPVENPEIAIAVLIENKTTKTGADIARIVLDSFFKLKPSEGTIDTLGEDESEIGGAEHNE